MYNSIESRIMNIACEFETDVKMRLELTLPKAKSNDDKEIGDYDKIKKPKQDS